MLLPQCVRPPGTANRSVCTVCACMWVRPGACAMAVSTYFVCIASACVGGSELAMHCFSVALRHSQHTAGTTSHIPPSPALYPPFPGPLIAPQSI